VSWRVTSIEIAQEFDREFGCGRSIHMGSTEALSKHCKLECKMVLRRIDFDENMEFGCHLNLLAILFCLRNLFPRTKQITKRTVVPECSAHTPLLGCVMRNLNSIQE
jgi:hypothetical protein